LSIRQGPLSPSAAFSSSMAANEDWDSKFIGFMIVIYGNEANLDGLSPIPQKGQESFLHRQEVAASL
jgi:hypothetical protein